MHFRTQLPDALPRSLCTHLASPLSTRPSQAARLAGWPAADATLALAWLQFRSSVLGNGDLSVLRAGRPLASRREWQAATSVQPRLPIKGYQDAARYDRTVGLWSRLAGQAVLHWMDVPANARWLDAGCGSGAVTALIVGRCAPASVLAIDPEPRQIEFARRRTDAGAARFEPGDVTAMKGIARGAFDAAIAALVLNLLRDPQKAASELLRVLRPGGVACAYSWDVAGGGSPIAPLRLAMRQEGVPEPVLGPSPSLCGEEGLRQLWRQAGLEQVVTCRIPVRRDFENLEDAWQIALDGWQASSGTQALGPVTLGRVKARFCALLRQDSGRPIRCTAAVVAVRGVAPA